MAKCKMTQTSLGFLALIFVISLCEASIFHSISNSQEYDDDEAMLVDEKEGLGSTHVSGDHFLRPLPINPELESLKWVMQNLLFCGRIVKPLFIDPLRTVLSLSRNDHLKVKVITVLGRKLPPVIVKLVRAVNLDNEEALAIEDQDLKYDGEFFRVSDTFPKDFDVGKYKFDFKVSVNHSSYTGKYKFKQVGRSGFQIYVKGEIKVENVEISVLDFDYGIVGSPKKLNWSANSSISLSSNHLQKLCLSFQLASPLGMAFEPHQALLKLRHETNIELVFLIGNSRKNFEIILDFFGLMDKLYYLSGIYDLQFLVGDNFMENSFLRSLGHIDLKLPEAPENATRPPLQPIDPLLRFGPKAEITPIFKDPEKTAPKELTLTFSVFTFVPFVGYLVGLRYIGVNFKKFPTSRLAVTCVVLFHVGLAAVLCLYVFFWLKLCLFTTMKILFFLGVFLAYVGCKTLSKLKCS